MIVDGEDKAGVAGDRNQAESVADIDAARKVKIYPDTGQNRTRTGFLAQHSRRQGK